MDDQEISDFDIAILDAVKSLIEVLVSKGVATHEEFARPFRHQLEESVRQRNGRGAGVFQILLQFCESREPVHALHRAKPSGSA
jgi:hypothetical protein